MDRGRLWIGLSSLSLSLLLLPGPALMGEEVELDATAESLRQAELAFARSVADQDFERFLSFIEEDAIFTAGGILRGREAVGEAWSSAFFGEGAARIRWRPETVVVLAAGDLGLSTGPYEITTTGADGEEVRRRGTFFSLWRRQADGSWKVALDGGVPGGAAEGESAGGSP